MTYDAKEAHVLSCLNQFAGDLVNPRVEISKGDCRDLSVEIFCLSHFGWLGPFLVFEVIRLTCPILLNTNLELCFPPWEKFLKRPI